MSFGKQQYTPPVFPAVAPPMIPGATGQQQSGETSMSIGWMLVALVGLCLGGAGMLAADTLGGDSDAAMAGMLGALGLGMVTSGAALHQAMRPMMPAVRPRPTPTMSAAADVVQVRAAQGTTWGTATVRFTDASGTVREGDVLQFGRMSVGQSLVVKYHPDGSDWVVLDGASAESWKVLARAPSALMGWGALLALAGPLFLI